MIFDVHVVVFIQVALTFAENKTGDHVRHEYDVEIQILCFFWVADMWLGIRDPGCSWPKPLLKICPKGDSSEVPCPWGALKIPLKCWMEHVSFSEFIHCIWECPFLVGFFHITNHLWGRQIQNDGVWSQFFWVACFAKPSKRETILQAKGGVVVSKDF